MAKLNQERRWWLAQWGRGGWSIGNPMKCSVKKWAAHTETLIKAGLLEGEERHNPGTGPRFCRITDLGLRQLSENSNAR
jgi:hypothetical protein